MMERVHPEFMKLDMEHMAESIETLPVNIGKGLEYWTNTMSREIGPLNPTEAPLVIAALRELADTIAKVFPESGKTADSIRELVTGKRVMVVKIPR